MLNDHTRSSGLNGPSPTGGSTGGNPPKLADNTPPIRAYVVWVSLVVALGGFVWGFDATVISGAVPFLKKYFDLTGTQGDLKLGLAVSCLGWGVLGGTAMAGLLSDRFGRKKVLIATAVLFTGSALLSALTRSFGVFVASRVVGGLAVGGAILIAPVYIAEISPARLRGGLVSLNQLMIVTGISGSFFSNYFLLETGQNNWRWMLGVEALPAALYFFLLFAVPESPRWLLGKKQEGRAREVLAKVCGPQEAEAQLQTIRESFVEKTSAACSRRREPADARAASERSPEKTSPALRSLGEGGAGLFGRRMRFVVLIALTIAFFQQITGINAILYYAPTIFAQTGGGQRAAFLQAAIVGLDNLLFTVVAIWLIDRLGRKPLLIIGAAGMAASLLTCGWAFHASNYHLTPRSFEMLQSAKVPADLLAELKSSEAKTFATSEDFMADLESQFGRDRIAPYRDALAGAALNIRAYVVLGAILGFVASFAISLGPVMWVLLSEIFPNQYRGSGISLAGFWNSAVSASVTLIFPWELSHLGAAGTFFVYGLLAAAALIFIVAVIPETKGKSLEELEEQLVH